MIAGEAPETRLFHHFGQGVQGERRHLSADAGMAGVHCFELARLLVVVLAARLQMKLPAVAADSHLHDFGSAFVDRGDANVALYFFHHVLVRITIASQRLDAGISR